MKRMHLSLALLLAMLLTTKVQAEEQTVLLEQLSKASEEGSIYEVRQDGEGDFVTIQEGVESLESGDTLLIYPGIYEENVEIMDKTVNLLGVDSDTCIIMADSSNYHHIPLTIGAGRVCNLTIYGTDFNDKSDVSLEKETDENTDITDIYLLQDKYPGYAVHIDQSYSYGRELSFENCTILSNCNQCVGIGTRGNSKITFTDCIMKSSGKGGCIFFHNTQDFFTAGESQLILRNCELTNYRCPYVIAVHSMGDLNPVLLTFQNVKVSTIAYERKDMYNDTNINTWFSVDSLDSPEVTSLLNEGVYTTSLQGNMVYKCSYQESQYLYSWSRERRSMLKNTPQLKEGISYIQMLDDRYYKQEKKPEIKERSRKVIDIYNENGESQADGWCGLSDIYLSEDSWGNTLIEMNYPRVVTQ